MARRVHIAGSASKQCDPDLLEWTHSVLTAFLRQHLRFGGNLIAQLGGEPLHPVNGLPRTFDWLAIEVALEALRSGEASPSAEDPLVLLRGSQRGFEQVPDDRRPLYEELSACGAVGLSLLPDTWRSGALIRQAQASLGDILLVVSGGAGVEHLADLYAERGRPVLPWHLNLGSSGGDGMIGGIGLAKKALTDAGPFLRLASDGSPEARLAQLRVDPARRGLPEEAGAGLAALVADLELPRVFCIRLLNPEISRFELVEDYFRQVIDPVLKGLGYRVVDLGHERQEAAWMNDEVFTQLHNASLVFCDLTAQRSNCFTEFGYALGNRQRFIISVHSSEKLPFDTDKLPCCRWSESEDIYACQGALRRHIDQFGTLPPLVQPARLV